MAYTKFGEYVRVLRVKNHEVMGDMAKMLGSSLPFLSNVENGKKNVPPEWIDKLVDHYNLNETEKAEMLDAIEESKTQYKLVMGEASNNKRRAALKIARSFDDMDDETALKIIELLSKNKGEE